MKKQVQLAVWECRCEVCGHEWKSNGEEPPLRCAKCKTPYWDRPKEGSNAAD